MRAGSCITGWPGPAAWLLYTIREEEGPLTQTQLSELLSLPKQTVNSALKKLVEAGVLRLEAVDGNLKNKRVCLTEQGEALLGHTVDRVIALEGAAVSHLAAEERAAMLSAEEKLLRAFQTEAEGFLREGARPE